MQYRPRIPSFSPRNKDLHVIRMRTDVLGMIQRSKEDNGSKYSRSVAIFASAKCSGGSRNSSDKTELIVILEADVAPEIDSAELSIATLIVNLVGEAD